MSHVQTPQGERRPLLNYSSNNRAFLFNEEDPLSENQISMPSRSRSKPSKKRKGGSSKIRVVKGRVQLRVAGYSGIQSLAPSHLIRHIPSAKLRLAARKLLGKPDKKQGRRSGGRKKKGRKTRKGKKGAPKKRKTKKKAKEKASKLENECFSSCR